MNYAGMKTLVMGLGLHGGGLESARFLAQHGAEVTVTDLRDEKILSPSIEQLEAGGTNGKYAYPIRYVLGSHEIDDFKNADMVIKNPGVRPDSHFLQAAKQVETDISIFLANSPARLCAVTGSKGKSSTASALHWVLSQARKQASENQTALPGKAWLGGNITVSPLTFLDELTAEDDVVLELSSWQLGDLRGARHLLRPRAVVMTAIMPDHLDRYGTMEAYIADKRIIYQGQDETDVTVASDDVWGKSFHKESRGRPLVYAEAPLPEGAGGGWLTGHDGPGMARLYGSQCNGNIDRNIEGKVFEAVPAKLLVPGYHQKKNLLSAALALLDLGLSAETVRAALAAFPGIEHRLEFFHAANGVRWYNDSAATIPEAAAAALGAFDTPVILVSGGTDKNLDYSPLVHAAPKAKTIILLAGTAGDKLKGLLSGAGIPFMGPFDNVENAVIAAQNAAGDGDTVILSPGCASFGMFLNEFDRGKKWKQAVIKLY
jgi:UDP-N-acetylmuramoylalanine--D-glutamate ligase